MIRLCARVAMDGIQDTDDFKSASHNLIYALAFKRAGPPDATVKPVRLPEDAYVAMALDRGYAYQFDDLGARLEQWHQTTWDGVTEMTVDKYGTVSGWMLLILGTDLARHLGATGAMLAVVKVAGQFLRAPRAFEAPFRLAISLMMCLEQTWTTCRWDDLIDAGLIETIACALMRPDTPSLAFAGPYAPSSARELMLPQTV